MLEEWGWVGTPWKTWASIPLPLACKASALPFELDSRSSARAWTEDLPLIRRTLYQLSYRRVWWNLEESNPWPFACYTNTLPTELKSRCPCCESNTDYHGHNVRYWPLYYRSLHHPVIETGACPWKGHMLPLHQWCIRAAVGIEPTTSSTQRKNHTPRPSGHILKVGIEPTTFAV